MGRRYPLQLLVPRTRSSHNLPAFSDANFGFKGGTSTDRFASVLIDSEVRTSVPPTLTNFGIGTLVSARGGDKPAVAGLAPRRHGAAFGDAFSRAVELVAGAGDLGLVAQRPVAKRGDRLQQIAPEGGQGIFNARRNGGKHGAGNEAVALQATQSQGQHPLRDAADRTAQFVKSQRTAAEPRHHQNRPFVADPRQHVADRAAVRGQMLVSRFHRCAFLAELRGYLFAPSYDLSPRDSTCSAQPIMRRRCRALP